MAAGTFKAYGVLPMPAFDKEDLPDADLEDHIVSWPLKWPKGAKGPGR